MSVILGSDFWNSIILLGAGQGFILSILLYRSKKNSKVSNRLLAALIFLLSLACTNLYITESGLYEDYRLLQILQEVFPWIIVMPIGPLIYFYVQSLVIKDFQLYKSYYRHFYTILIDLVPKVTAWVFIIGVITGIIQMEASPEWGHFIDSFNTYSDIPRWLSITLYLFFTKRFLKQHPCSQSEGVESTLFFAVRTKWIHQFLHAFLAFQVIWFLFLVPYIIPSTRGYLLDTMSYYPIYIPLAILIYWLGFKGYLHTQLSTDEPLAKELPIQLGPQKLITPSLSFSDEEVATYTASLRKAMQEAKLYLEPSLNVQAVSSHTSIPQKTISYILNNYHGKSFNEFVNEYRINEVKKRLLEKGNDHLTISGIALDCGFNSQATFQRAFKNVTGVSPKEYLTTHTQKTA